MPEQPVFEFACIAVEKHLKAQEFIETHHNEIFKRLSDAEARARAREAGPEANVVFVAECLPFVAGIVHVGSQLDDFREARDWALEKLPYADAVSVLSALTFLYIVEKGLKSATKENSAELPVWRSMSRRLDSLLPASGSLAGSAAPPA
jgi:hypothetical protein